MKKFLNIFLSKQFLLFIVIGVNTFNSTIFAFLLSILIPNANISFIIGYILSLFIAFMLNCLFVFKTAIKYKKFINFSLSYIPNFIIQNIIVLIVYNYLGFHKLIAFALAAIIGIPVTFLLLKFKTFHKK